MSTVTATPAYGSVECFARIIRERATTTEHAYSLLAGVLSAIIDGQCTTDEDKVAHARNALAAVEVVAAELRAA